MFAEKKKSVIVVCIILVLLLVLISLFIVNSKTYTITIDTGNSKYVEKVKRNSKLKKPVNPSKSGYEFVGWYKDGKLYDFDLKVKENFTLKAKYEKEDEEEPEETFKEITTTTTTDVTTTKKDDRTTTKKTTKNNSSSKSNNTNTTNAPVTTTTTNKPVTTTTATTTTTTTKAVTYSAKRVPVEGSTIGQERIYVVNNTTGAYVNGTVTITYQDGHSETVSIPSSGKMVVGSVVSSVTNARGN